MKENSMGKNVNVEKGKKGFQKTQPKRVDAPASNTEKSLGWWGRMKENRKRYRNTSNLKEIGPNFGFTIASWDGKGWVNSNQGGPGYRSVSFDQDRILNTALNLDNAAYEHGSHLTGQELDEFTEFVTQQRETLMEASKPFKWLAKNKPSMKQRQELTIVLKQVESNIAKIRNGTFSSSADSSPTIDTVYAQAQNMIKDKKLSRN